jgi:hypothetical protein
LRDLKYNFKILKGVGCEPRAIGAGIRAILAGVHGPRTRGIRPNWQEPDAVPAPMAPCSPIPDLRRMVRNRCLLLALAWPGACLFTAAQEGIGHHEFVPMAMVVTDHAQFTTAFVPPPDGGVPELWVLVPKGVLGAGAEGSMERLGRNGMVRFAAVKHRGYRKAACKLRFHALAIEEATITASFRTVRGPRHGGRAPKVRGTVWFPRFDGMGPARVTFSEGKGSR